ncbi:M23 family metallopeptidase [Bacillus shivajii]|uniref:peptidoglycan DD-metalloendopeptidase family protein n=1 Tax=Bacillus shivajii TaxID=1983719 RepID=UPI001CFAC0DB|nr:M23 family metallopeptidase [Bacillus shivajii]UCZ53226.1 M23 family metallopeptidase [Bacillus shivajii]
MVFTNKPFFSLRGFTIFALIFCLFFVSFSKLTSADTTTSEEDTTQGFQMIYHVYYGDNRIGIVDDKQIIEDFKENHIETASTKYEDINLTFENEITYIPEQVFMTRALNDLTVDLLEAEVNIHAKAHLLTIGDEEVGHVSYETNMDDFLRSFILEYVPEEELEAYEGKEEDEELSLEVGDSKIINIDFTDDIEWKVSSAYPEDILTEKDAFKKIQQGTLEEELYTVDKGDVLGTIAADHDLTTSELLSLNPDITEDSLLQIGDKINVTVLRPMSDVIIEKVGKVEEEIPYKTETKEDSALWQGETEVRQQGEEGKKIIEYTVTYENGQTINRETTSEEVISEPKNRVVVNGTKTSPSRGTGQLGWPAVGGYISSYQGTRWGRFHRGIDIARPSNYNILAADNGTVSSAGWENGYGNTIRINHNNGLETMYAHLERIDVNVGQTVGKGQVIGRMGSTGNSTGIHLHFEVYQNGQLKDPMDFLNY